MLAASIYWSAEVVVALYYLEGYIKPTRREEEDRVIATKEVAILIHRRLKCWQNPHPTKS